MCIKHKKCNAWISLDSVGINAQGCIKNTNWLYNIIVPCNHSILNQSIYIDLPTEKLTLLKHVAQGSFGYIDLAIHDYQSTHHEVYIKRPILPGRSLLYEACIQKLVRDSLVTIGFLTGAPRIINIFALRDESVCFAMEQIHGAVTLDRFLNSLNYTQISNVIIDCLLQLCMMTIHLNNVLGVNHRDLKPSNFLIVENNNPIQRNIILSGEILEITSKYSLTFIDFGFSCLGSTLTHVSDISLSTVYSKADPCPKEGRDMYLFLAFVYIDYYKKIPQKLLALFEKWLDIPYANICSFIKKYTNKSKKWIYFIIGNEKIKKFNSCSYNIIKDLMLITTS